MILNRMDSAQTATIMSMFHRHFDDDIISWSRRRYLQCVSGLVFHVVVPEDENVA